MLNYKIHLKLIDNQKNRLDKTTSRRKNLQKKIGLKKKKQGPRELILGPIIKN
jgi:hypothetical protein